MSYNFVEKKLKANGVVILDGGNGGELEISGAKMDKDLWAGKCAINDPERMLQVHEKYINAGADIITSNTYAITPISMKEYGYDQFTKTWNEESVKIALKAANHSDREIAVAGSVSTSGSWDKLSEEDIKPGFNEQLKILKEAGVDLIILEAMTSKDRTVENIIECSKDVNLPIWLSISCAIKEDENELMHGYQESITNSKAKFYDTLENSLSKFSKMHDGPILVAHSNIKVTGEAVKVLKKIHKGIVGAYPNNGYFEKPHWKLINDITPSKYLEEAKNWVSNGAQIIGGCCGVGPDKIEAVSILK